MSYSGIFVANSEKVEPKKRYLLGLTGEGKECGLSFKKLGG
jgi:hypothetical protein